MSQFPNTTTADGIWTLKKVRRAILGGNWPEAVIADEFFANTVLLLQGDTYSASMLYNAFGDASNNAHDITPVGGVHGTPFSPYNESWSVDFDGSGDYLTAAGSSDFDLTGDFTIECWAWLDSTAQYRPLFAVQGTDGFSGLRVMNLNTDEIEVILIAGNTSLHGSLTSTSSPISLSTWHHIAVVRSGSTITAYVDGTSVGSFSSSNWTGSALPVYIGTGRNYASSGFVAYWDGYISNFRIVKGTAVYTSNFTPSTTPLTAVSGTSLLTCNANRFIDTSSNDHTITVNGDPEIKGFSPFADTDTVTGSGYFDGDDNYLSVPASTDFAFGTGDFTVEFWGYFNSITNYDTIYIHDGASGSLQLFFVNGKLRANNNLVAAILDTATSISTGRWIHFAAVRNSGTFKWYLNGVEDATTSNSTNLGGGTTNLSIGEDPSSDRDIDGYISNLRVVKGTAVYTSAFTPPTSPLTAVSGTSLLTLQNRGANRNIGFIDSSHPTRQITRNGNVTQGSFSPFSQDEGKWGNYFGTSSGDILSVSSANIGSTTSTFTIEGWVYLTADPVQVTYNIPQLFTLDGSGGTVYLAFGVETTANKLHLYWFDGSAGVNCFATTSLELNTWYHIACVVNSNAIAMYLNGVSESLTGTTTLTNRGGTTNNLTIGSGNFYQFYGYVSNARLTTTAVYTSSFTPSTTPLTDITNTSLLTCQSNRFVDNSSNAHSITVNGNTEVTPFSPFAPSTAYAPATKGGSGYFDGTGDNLDWPITSSNTINGTEDFTIEGWVYINAHKSHNYIYSAGYPIQIYASSNGQLSAIVSTTDSSNYFGQCAGAIGTKQWAHFAYVRDGNDFELFINGVSVDTATSSNSVFLSTTYTNEIGDVLNSGGSSYTLDGYLSNFRIVKGEAVYTSNFTPPTAPVTKTDSTIALMNFTNAGIYDGTGRNVLETVGDAHVENSVKKYGTGSMQFDGTGDYLEAPASHLFDFGDGDFTIEFWMYNQSDSDDRGGIFELYIDDNNMLRLFRQTGDILQALVRNAGSDVVDITTALSEDQWTHVALVVNNGTMTLYKDGTSVGSDSSFTLPDLSSAQVLVGLDLYATDRWYTGYIDDLRVTKGVARYTANFTPPAAVLPKQ